MKISIMYRLMLLLMLNKKITREYAANKFEVSTRSIQRYVDALCEAGVPITPMPGRKGGYTIPDNYKLPCTLFTRDEIDRITTSISAMSMSFGDVLSDELLEKLTSISSGGKKNIVPSIMIDAGVWNNPEVLKSKLDTIAAAIENNLVVDIDYTDKNGQYSKRLFDSYCLVLKEGIWYVYGWCHIRLEYRLFRLARMRAISFTDDSFESRVDADLNNALTAKNMDECSLQFEFDDSILAKVEEWVGEDCIVKGEGRHIASAVVSDGDELIMTLLGLGSSVKVISPSSVVDKVKSEIDKLVNRYKKD